MVFTLGAHIHACLDAEVPIFLDLAADRYFRLKPDAEGAFLRLAKNENPRTDDQTILAGLVTKGILRDAGPLVPDAINLLTPPPPLEDELSGDAKPTLHIVASIMFRRLRVRFARRHARRVLLNFDVARNSARSLNPQNKSVSKMTIAINAGLVRSDMVVAPADRCLERSLALVSVLRGANERAELVLGVTARPFSAHCWVQQGAVLLGDRIERVRNFTPIAVL